MEIIKTTFNDKAEPVFTIKNTLNTNVNSAKVFFCTNDDKTLKNVTKNIKLLPGEEKQITLVNQSANDYFMIMYKYKTREDTWTNTVGSNIFFKTDKNNINKPWKDYSEDVVKKSPLTKDQYNRISLKEL